MKLPQLSLQGIFWLLFLATVVSVWAWEGFRLRGELRTTNRKRPVVLGSANYITFRKTVANGRKAVAEAILAEADPGPYLRDVTILTAVRRAQQKPDPVRIEAEVVTTSTAGWPRSPIRVRGIIRNQDSERRSFTVRAPPEGEPDYSHHWRVELADDKGHVVADSNVTPRTPDGLIHDTTLAYDETISHSILLDPRHYVSRPPSGRYQLRIIYSDLDNAKESDSMDCIAWKSEPIWVEVTNYSYLEYFDFVTFRFVAIVVLAAGAISLIEQRSKRITTSLRRWNWIACLAVIMAATLWMLDVQSLEHRLDLLKPDSDANWTLRAISP